MDAHNAATNQSVDPKEFQRAYFPDWLLPPHSHPMSAAGPARGLEPWGNIWKYTRELRDPDAYYEEIPAELLPPPVTGKKGKGKDDDGVAATVADTEADHP